MAGTNMKAKLCQEIVDAIAEAIKSNSDGDEIRDMFVHSKSFMSVVNAWTDPITHLDLFQTAIIHRHRDMVKYLHKLDVASFNKHIVESGPVLKNSPLHLACLVGDSYALQFIVNNVDNLHLPSLLTTKGIISYPSCKSDLQNIPAVPFEICVKAGNVDCCIFLSQIICKMSSGFSHLFRICKSSPIHQACYLGSPDFLKLLIQSGYQEQIHERNVDHYLPLHIAAIHAMPDCLEVLLQNGANVNAYTDCRSALHLLYTWNRQPLHQARCTKILLAHGLNVNSIDHNSNAPLDHLAWAYGQKEHIRFKNREACFLSALMHQSYSEEKDISLSDYQEGILGCIELLLKAGAQTSISTSPSVSEEVDHTVMHTLLQNISWPHSSCLLRNPKSVYRAIELLFRYGADPNAVAKTNKTSCFTLLLLHSLHEIQALSLKCQFVYLFIQYGADLESKVLAPANFRDYYSDRIWSVYPVNLARQEKHPIEVIQLMFYYMSQGHLFRALRCKKMQGWQLALMDAREDTYRRAWLALRKELLHEPRSLKRMCKLVIFRDLGLEGRHLNELPKELKQYVLSPFA